MNSYLGLVITALICLFMVILFIVTSPGHSLRGKCDHYLCLDGQLISFKRASLKVGSDFFRRRQNSWVSAFILLIALMWSPVAESQIIEVKKPIDQRGEEASKSSLEKNQVYHALNSKEVENVVLSWNLMQKSPGVGAEEVGFSKDESHFYRKNWIELLPFEWEKR